MCKRLGPYLLGPNDTPENGIYTGDCRELALAIPDESVDLIWTDVPYSINETGIMFDGAWSEMLLDVFRECFRATKESACAIVVCSPPHVFVLRDILENAGWTYKGLHAWCSSGSFYPSSFWNPSWEPMFLMCKGKATMLEKIGRRKFGGMFGEGFNYNDSSVFARPRGGIHPAQKPIELVAKYIVATTDIHNIILDPFCGSGTTVVASILLSRRYLAFEINPNTAGDARERVRNTQPPLFVPEPEQIALWEE